MYPFSFRYIFNVNEMKFLFNLKRSKDFEIVKRNRISQTHTEQMRIKDEVDIPEKNKLESIIPRESNGVSKLK
jgi:hypothetical protein